jgi:mRNA interferase RelE/StbE
LTFSLILWDELADEINRMPGKIRRIIKPTLKRLEDDPFPESKEENQVFKGGIIIYRLHISEKYTVFYEINKEEKLVIVQEVLTIEQAHKKYG